MSTVKASDLKLRLPLDMVNSQNDQVKPFTHRDVNREVYIFNNAWEVLVWGWKCNTEKLDSATKAIIAYIETNALK